MMNKLLLILSILITKFSIVLAQQGQKTIEIKYNFVGNCLNVGEETSIEAEITNNVDKVFYLNSNVLLFNISFYDQEGEPLFATKRVTVIHEEPIKTEDKFVLIKPKSKTKIKFKTHIFSMFDFKPNIEYTLVSSYSNDENYKWKKKNTLKYVRASLFNFVVCE